ncbi:MAG: AraC family ligand binding domain-containing protein, partial [Treponema sp.]|nr:AraC family ligand binding domain-containing protein [Treponema sp.]
MLIKDAVHVYRLIGGSKLTLHGRHHAHEKGYEIHFFLEGNGTFLMNHSKYSIDGNRLFLTGPGEYHSILPEAIKSPVSYYAILFEPELPVDEEAMSLLERVGRRHFSVESQERFLIEEVYRLQGKNQARAAEHLLLSLLHRWYNETARALTV